MEPCRTTLNPNDRISQLPDSVICHILSRLPTDDATKTSVLSRNWQHKWTSIYDFDIDDRQHGSNLVIFINYVNRILFRTCNSNIRKFHLSCYECDPSWISCVLMRNVEDLMIIAEHVPGIDSWCFRNWTLLTKLHLSVHCTLVLPVDSRFPNLRKLVLVGEGNMIIKPEQNSVEGRVILIFPVLEDLFLDCEWMDVNFVEIHAPELITFNILCVDGLRNYEIKIFGVKLTSFSSQCGSIYNFDLHSSPAVSNIALNHFLDENPEHKTYLVPRAHEILKQSPHLESLMLSGDLVKVLVPSNSGLVFPTFNQLKDLRLVGLSNIKDVVELLQLLPRVELLYVQVNDWDNNKETGQPWSRKIVSNLKKVALEGFCGYTPQVDFSKFVLENAENLKKMSLNVSYGASAEVKATTNLMSKLLGKSSSCVIHIS